MGTMVATWAATIGTVITATIAVGTITTGDTTDGTTIPAGTTTTVPATIGAITGAATVIESTKTAGAQRYSLLRSRGLFSDPLPGGLKDSRLFCVSVMTHGSSVHAR